ncbi:MAG: hypothetical protein K9N49_06595 [Candidatus Marinimicrobia bacterium]|nr:hypothetical protein [Candidatus Neomarinimicrobiota bacterium]
MKRAVNSGPGRAAAERRRLAEWLAEWDLEQRLRAAPAELAEGGPRPGQGRHPSRPPRGDVQPGDIRLLVPFGPDADTLLYMAVLTQEADGAGWWLPFARFATPAVPGELALGLRVPALRVLCLWNGRRVAAGVAPASWRVKRMTPRQLAWTVQAHACHLAGHPPPPELIARSGPPLCHPLDPRHDYLDAERRRLDPYFPLAAPAANAPGGCYPVSATAPPERLAAEPRISYNPSPTPNNPRQHRPSI